MKLGRNLILIVAVMAIAGCGKKGMRKKAGLKLEKMSVPVTTATAKMGSVRQVLEVGGAVKAFKELNIVPDIPGRIKQIMVREGDLVKKGDVLAVLDTKQVRIQLRQAVSAVSAAKAQFDNAKKQLARTKQLYRRGASTKQQLDSITAGFRAAKANLSRAMAAKALAMHSIDVSTMKAPFDGMITGKFKDPGDMINPLSLSVSPLVPGGVVRVAQLDRVLVDVFVSDRDWAWIKKGMPAYIRVDTWKGHVFVGKVTKTAPAANAMSRTFKIEVTVPNPGVKLRPGMYARINIVHKVQKGVVVPLDALVKRAGRFIVFTIKDNIAHLHEVTVGLRNDKKAIIMKGINAGDTVVVQGNIALREGTPIRIMERLGAPTKTRKATSTGQDQ